MPCTIWPFLYTKIICYLRWSRPCPAVFEKGEHHAQYPCRKLARKMALGWGFHSRVLVCHTMGNMVDHTLWVWTRHPWDPYCCSILLQLERVGFFRSHLTMPKGRKGGKQRTTKKGEPLGWSRLQQYGTLFFYMRSPQSWYIKIGFQIVAFCNKKTPMHWVHFWERESYTHIYIYKHTYIYTL